MKTPVKLTDKVTVRKSCEERWKEKKTGLCACGPVSSPDGTVRPGQMSDCFFDLPAAATRASASARGRDSGTWV
ncbi:MAG TPA: hypothetical protein VJ654_04835 [Noviherbaspirillum sp.]|nr:hypothetical protein [Noviherbaspirillum sp.]